jgi:hypothetical protein
MIVKRDATFTIPLEEVCNWLGYEYEIDPYEDVYYESSLDDLDHMDFGKYDVLKKYLKYPFLKASEYLGRESYVSAILNARNRDIVDALMKIEVVGEYVGLDSEDQEVDVSCPSSVIDAQVNEREDVVEITIRNPEHLVNDIIRGVGEFYPYEIKVDRAQDKEVRERIHWISEYFSVYGDSIPRTERIEPDHVEQSSVEDFIHWELVELTEDEIAEELDNLESDQLLEALTEIEKFEIFKDMIPSVKKSISKRIKGQKEDLDLLIKKLAS